MEPKEKSIKEVLTTLRSTISEAEAKIKSIKAKCIHRIDASHDADGSFAVCIICDSNFGHFCKSSPDKVCHSSLILHKDDVGVKLFDGSFWPYLPHSFIEKFDKSKSEEHRKDCIFCGKANERK